MALLDFLKRSPSKKTCARCGQRAAHGYSPVAESHPKQITPLCLPCLSEQLHHDYADFRGRAVVLAPAKGLPCYVFRGGEFLRSVSANSAQELDALLDKTGKCSSCPASGSCLWIESRGVTLKTFGDVLEKGIQKTILAWGNPPPRPLCANCTAAHIAAALQVDGFEFFEICSPHGFDTGIVMPMAY